MAKGINERIMRNYDLLILGNGFDLACGYKTSYDDFYNFLKLAVKANTSVFLTNFNSQFPQIQYECAQELLIKFKNLIDNDFKENIFIKYFLNYNANLNSWVAFEKELLCIVKGYDAFFEALKNYDRAGSYCCDFTWKVKNNSEALRLFIFIKSCKYYQLENIINDPNVTQFDFLITELTNLTPIQWRVEVEKYIDNFIDYLYEELKAFSELFAVYLHIVTLQDPNNEEFNFKADKIINFNYTNTYNKKHKSEKEVDVCYLNGSITGEIDNIVFGFNSDENFKNSGLDILSKSSQRIDKLTDFTTLKKFLPEETAIWSEFKIGVYGHSLDKADKDTLNMIFSNYKNATIDIYYLNDKSKKALISNIKNILSQSKFNVLSANQQINFISCSNQDNDEEEFNFSFYE